MCKEQCGTLSFAVDQNEPAPVKKTQLRRVAKRIMVASAVMAGVGTVAVAAPSAALEPGYSDDLGGIDVDDSDSDVDNDVDTGDSDADSNDSDVDNETAEEASKAFDDDPDDNKADFSVGAFLGSVFGGEPTIDPYTGLEVDDDSASLAENNDALDEVYSSQLDSIGSDPSQRSQGQIDADNEAAQQASIELGDIEYEASAQQSSTEMGQVEYEAAIREDAAAIGLTVTFGDSTVPAGAQAVDLTDLDSQSDDGPIVDTSELPSNDPARTVTFVEQFPDRIDLGPDTMDTNEEAARAGVLEDSRGSAVVDSNGNPVAIRDVGSSTATSDDGGDDSPSTSSNADTPATVCTDHDGDGWGWDGNDTCPMPYLHQTRPEAPRCVEGGKTDHDGDGWGWENHQSCRV